MSDPIVCPKCSAARQKNAGRFCTCGYDFNNETSSALAKEGASTSPQKSLSTKEKVLLVVCFTFAALFLLAGIVIAGCSTMFKGL